MKIAVLGATGQTGQYLVSQALQHGHTVTAIIRNLGKMTVKHDNLKVVEADIFSSDSLKEHFQDQDAVISCLGFPIAILSGVTGYTQSMRAVISAMREVKVNRMITMTSWYTEPNSGTQSSYLIRFLLLPMIGSVLSNMYEMENILKAIDDINWTVVRPPGLKNQPATGLLNLWLKADKQGFNMLWTPTKCEVDQMKVKEFLTHDGYFVPDSNGHPVGSYVGRGDVARFMLSLLSSSIWVKQAVAVTTE